MKRIVSILIVLILLSTLAYAEIKKLNYIGCDCNNDPCTCYIQLGDQGGAVKVIIQKLIERDYLPQNTEIGLFSEEVKEAVICFQSDNKLPQTGTMDNDTLTLLLFNALPSEQELAVYIPTDGGIKRHSNPECCQMYDPRKVSIRNAIELGFEECGKCMKK